MVCKNCGAWYEDGKPCCPFCGEEDVKTAQTVHRDEIHNLRRKTEEMKQKPQHVVKKMTFYLIRGTILLILLSVLVFIIVSIVSKHRAKKAYENQQTRLEVLERYYQEKQYDKIEKYLAAIPDSYAITYEKYQRAGLLYEKYNFDMECLKEESKYIKSVENPQKQGLISYLTWSFETLDLIFEYENEGFIYQEEDAVRDISERMQEMLSTVVFLSEEEIMEVLKVTDKEERERVLSEYADKVIVRMKEQ